MNEFEQAIETVREKAYQQTEGLVSVDEEYIEALRVMSYTWDETYVQQVNKSILRQYKPEEGVLYILFDPLTPMYRVIHREGIEKGVINDFGRNA